MALIGIPRTGADRPAEAWPWEGDIPYPSDDGEPMAETDLQYSAITDAVFALKTHLATLGRSGTVRGDCALYYDPDILTAYVAPDVLLAFDVTVPRDAGFAPWEQGKVPDLVVEVASPSTHAQDSGLKRKRYAALGIAEYWQYDPHHQYLSEDLLGWRLRRTGRYARIPVVYDPGRAAWIGESAVLETVWGVEDGTGALRLWNPAAQAWYLTDREAEAARRREAVQRRREAARADREAAQRRQEAARADREATQRRHEAARADQEAAQRRQEAARADREATQRRQEAARADREATQRRHEAARADQEAAQRRQEAARAAQAEAEIARLRALLRDAGHEAADFSP